MKKLIKKLIKFILIEITDLLASLNLSKNKLISEKTLLLIRLDAIGDYILFRNFIEILRKDGTYKDYKITLVGNVLWKNLSEELDRDYIDKFIWIDRKIFEINPIYRYRKLKEIAKQGYEIVINPTYSRSFFGDDSIIRVVKAKEKIGSIGDLSNITPNLKKISDKYYTKLIPAKSEIIFEFYRDKEFFENLLLKTIDIKKPFIKINSSNSKLKLPKKYAILFIGASSKWRKWSIKNFVEVGKFLKDRYDYNIIICGGADELEEANEFMDFANYDYIDCVGKTSLIELLLFIKNSNLILSNETMVPHIAVALDKKNIFVIYNGNHYGRFIPYPKEIWPYYFPIFHPEIEKDLSNYKKLSNSYGFGSNLNINDITVNKVITTIENNLDH